MLLRSYITVGIVNMVPLTMQLLHIMDTFSQLFQQQPDPKSLKRNFL